MSNVAQPQTSQHFLWLTLSGGVLLAAWLLRVNSSNAVELQSIGWQLPELCTLNRMWGIKCPGCGLTRSTLAAVRGQWGDAIRFNVAGPLVFFLLASQIPLRTIALLRERRGLPTVVPGGGLLWAYALLLLMIQWGVRLVVS